MNTKPANHCAGRWNLIWRVVGILLIVGSIAWHFRPVSREKLIPFEFGTRRWGYLNQHGDTVMGGRFLEAGEFDQNDVAIVRLSEKEYTLVNRFGEHLCDQPWEFIFHRPEGGLYSVSAAGKSGWIDATGKTRIPIQYDHTGLFEEKTGLAIACIGNDRFFINRNGKVAIPGPFETAFTFDAHGHALVMTKEKFGWIDARGNWVTSFPRANILAIGGFDEYCEIEVAQVPPVPWGDNKLKGIVHKSGKRLLEPEWEKISLELIDGSRNYFKVEKEGKHAAFDPNGRLITPLEWDELWAWDDSNLHGRKGSDRYLISLETGQTKLVGPYKSMVHSKLRDLIIAWNGKHFGIIDSTRNEVIPFVWDSLYPVNLLGMIEVAKSGRYGFIDLKGNVVIPIEYDVVFDQSSFAWSNRYQVIIAAKDGKCGALDASGNPMVELRWSNCSDVESLSRSAWILFVDQRRWQLLDLRPYALPDRPGDPKPIFPSKSKEFELITALMPVSNPKLIEHVNQWAEYFFGERLLSNTTKAFVLLESATGRLLRTHEDRRDSWPIYGVLVGSSIISIQFFAWLKRRRRARHPLTAS